MIRYRVFLRGARFGVVASVRPAGGDERTHNGR